jgi:hypothetical protein
MPYNMNRTRGESEPRQKENEIFTTSTARETLVVETQGIPSNRTKPRRTPCEGFMQNHVDKPPQPNGVSSLTRGSPTDTHRQLETEGTEPQTVTLG